MLYYYSAGGLVTAVAPVVIKGNGLWVGWPGLHSNEPITEIPESDPSDQTPTAGLRSDQVNIIVQPQIASFTFHIVAFELSFFEIAVID